MAVRYRQRRTDPGLGCLGEDGSFIGLIPLVEGHGVSPGRIAWITDDMKEPFQCPHLPPGTKVPAPRTSDDALTPPESHDAVNDAKSVEADRSHGSGSQVPRVGGSREWAGGSVSASRRGGRVGGMPGR